MASDFGFSIGVEGEREFRAALKDINQSFKVLGSEMQLVTSQFDKNDTSVRALASRNEVLNREIDQQRGKIETLRSALQNASDSFGENDRRTQAWQIQLNKAQAELNGMERELSQNEAALQNVEG
jgi:phage-related minor tail protein